MEIIINGKSCELKLVNAERRIFFANNVLSIYNYEAANFNDFLKETQKILNDTHKLKMSIEDVEKNFFKHYTSSVINSLWTFLNPDDKSFLKQKNNIKLEESEIKKFIEWCCSKIKGYAAYVNKNSGGSQDAYEVYSYLARVYGWSFEQIKEMDELELSKAIENAVEISERENVTSINSQALAGAYAGGSKKAKTQIDSINKKITTKTTTAKASQFKEDNISRDDIRKIMEARNGR